MQRIIGVILVLFFYNSSTTSAQGKITFGCKQYYLNGPNVAWNNYGWDFGNNAAGYGGGNGYSSTWWETHFTQLQNYGANSARVWIHCKAEHNPLFDGSNNCTGLNTNFFANMDDMLDRAKNHNIMIILCLFDFHLVNQGSREQIVRDVNKTNAYINNALIPMVQRYANQCNLLAYEIFNEPEWVMNGVPGAGNAGGSITISEMQRFVGKCAEAVHNNSTQLVTVGSASLRYNSDVAPASGNYWKNSAIQAAYSSSQAYLDFYQIHYYDWMLNSGNNWAPYNRPASYWGLDKPILIGESGNTGHYNYQQQFDLGYANDFAGTMIWASSPSTGGAASWSEFNNQMKNFRDAHPTEVDFSCGAGSCCTKPNLGINRTTCGGGITFPYLLNSNAGSTTNKTYTWKLNNIVISGATSSTYSATGPGTYVVIVDSGLVQHCIVTDTVILSNTLATPTLGANFNLCTPAFRNLDGNNYGATPVTYVWKKNGSVIIGETSRYLNNVRTAGTYSVEVAASGCPMVTSSVNVTASAGLPLPTDGCRSGAGIVNLSVAGSSTYNWYANQTGGSSINSGLTYNPSLPASTTTTYWVEDAASVAGQVGPTAQIGGGFGRNPVTDDFRFRTNFNTGPQSVTINSVKVWAWINTAGVTYYVNIRILDQTGTPQFTVDVPISSPTTNWNMMVLPLGIVIPANVTNWKMDARGTTSSPTCDLYYAPSGAAYPYNSTPSSGMLTITGHDATWDPNGYSYFYDWQISTGTGCGRMPVVATTTGCSIPAPVTLLSFSARPTKNSTELIWSTTSEYNNDYFEIEKSIDKIYFESIGKVPKKIQGNTVNHYMHEDKDIAYGQSYYRLKQVDINGIYTYSSIVSNRYGHPNDVIIHPQPATSDAPFNIKFILEEPEEITLTLKNSIGDVVFSQKHNGQTGENTISINHNYNKGLYILTINTSIQKWIEKIIIQ